MTYSRCIITAASNKFFPSLINLIGSIKATYPSHPDIYVYDLGLSGFLRKDIEKIDKVKVIDMPRFVPHWRSCYTWKTYILHEPIADLNFYIDAGSQALRSLEPLFEKIEKNGYLLVSQGPDVRMSDITPAEYIDLFDFETHLIGREIIAAGIVGWKRGDMTMKTILTKLYNAGIAGLCIGFSAQEQWKNRGKNRNGFVRNCLRFRHDTTLLSIFALQHLSDAVIEPIDDFDGHDSGHPGQFLWSIRMNYKNLKHIGFVKTSFLTTAFLQLFFLTKKINSYIKNK